MDESEPRELELTPELIKYINDVAKHEVRKRCPKGVRWRDVAQEALLKMIARPPKYDPSKGASVKTFIYTIVLYTVLDYAVEEDDHRKHYRQFTDPVEVEDDEGDESIVKRGVRHRRGRVERSHVPLMKKDLTTEDVFRFIDDEESQKLCTLYVECECNASETARRLEMSEGTVRYRLKLLKPKLEAAGFTLLLDPEVE